MKNHNWHIQLAHFIEKQRTAPFVWGKHDCCLFCADSAVIICGVDPAESYRGKYHDERSAYRMLQKIGGGSVAAVLSRYFSEIDPDKIQRGDLCLVEADIRAEHVQSHYACALCFSNRLWVTTPEDQGLGTLSLENAVRAWRVE